MADNSSILNLSNLNVYGDLFGSILAPKVISINNVKHGVLNVENGGTGLSVIPNGQILVGQDGKIGFISGTQNGESLVWSNDLGAWQIIKFNGLSDLNINFSENALFNISTEVSGYNNKTYNITNKEYQQGVFLATPISGSGGFLARQIESSDLPNVWNFLTLTNVSSSGQHDGNFNGQFTGNFDGQFIGFFSGNISGDGSEIDNIDPNKISSLDIKVKDIISNLSSAYLYDLTSSNVYFENGFYNGLFSGDGSGLTNLPVLDPISGDNIEISKNVSGNSIISTSKVINISNIYSQEGNIQNINAQEIISNKITSNFFGSGEGLYNIPISALQSSSIFINEQALTLGEKFYVSGAVDYIETDTNITASLELNKLSINLSPDIQTNSITSSFIFSDIMSGNAIYGVSLYGDGSDITNIDVNNIPDLRNFINSLTNTDNINVVMNADNKISLSDNLQLKNFNSISGSIAQATISNATIYNLSSSNIKLDNIEANSIKGDGTEITGLQVSNIVNFYSEARKAYKGGTNVVIESDGTISLIPSLAGVGSVSAGSNIVGGGSGETITLGLMDDILLNTVTASFFVGNGSKISGITFSQLSGIPSFSQYVTTSSLNDYSSSAASTYASNQQVVEILNTFSPDSTVVYFTSSIGSVSLYDIVALNSSGLVRANKSSQIESNAFGVVSKISGTNVGVKVCGEIQINSAQSFTTGSVVWVGTNGQATDYNSIGSGNYATQIGYSIGGGKIVIVPRIAYKIA